MLIDKIKLEPGEKVLIQTHRHWFIIGGQLTATVLLALLPLLALLFISVFITSSNTNLDFSLADHAAAVTFVYLLYLIFVWISAFSVWTNYYLDLLTVTDRRAVLIDHKGFFWRTVTSFRLERMQDMNIEINGFMATILNFGTIELETASDNQEEFKATGMPNPAQIKSVVMQAADNLISSTPQHDGIQPIDKPPVAQ